MKMKNKWLITGVVGALLLTSPLYARDLWSAASPGQVYAAEQSTSADKRLISVTGQGEITITPDVAYISLGIQTEAATANEAQMANAKAFASLEKMLFEDFKLDKKDVKTSGFSVQPEYSYTDRDPKIKGYSASQILQVTYRDLDKLGAFLDAASRAGANRIHSVQFSTEKGQEYELQAINKAMDNAKAKAETIAKFAGKELKGIVHVVQGGGNGIPVQRANVQFMSADMAFPEAAPSTSISVGELKVTTTVSVQYEF